MHANELLQTAHLAAISLGPMLRIMIWMILGISLASFAVGSSQTRRVRMADGFDFPVGKPEGQGYYIYRGFSANGHLGEDWNGKEGGDTDLGDPVYTIGNGMVILARNMRKGWGNVVIVRHAYRDRSGIAYSDSLYAHLDRITVREGQQVQRGQQVGTIGSNRGMYTAHLHFEIRKNLAIGMNRSAFARDLSNYYVPSKFISERRKIKGAGSAQMPVETFAKNTASDERSGDVLPTRSQSRNTGGVMVSGDSTSGGSSYSRFRVNRLRENKVEP